MIYRRSSVAILFYDFSGVWLWCRQEAVSQRSWSWLAFFLFHSSKTPSHPTIWLRRCLCVEWGCGGSRCSKEAHWEKAFGESHYTFLGLICAQNLKKYTKNWATVWNLLTLVLHCFLYYSDRYRDDDRNLLKRSNTNGNVSFSKIKC